MINTKDLIKQVDDKKQIKYNLNKPKICISLPQQVKLINSILTFQYHNQQIQPTLITILWWLKLNSIFTCAKLTQKKNFLIFVLIVMGRFVHNAPYMAAIESMKYLQREKQLKQSKLTYKNVKNKSQKRWTQLEILSTRIKTSLNKWAGK